ncbi:B-cell receptor CD22-like [Rhineura floridana]|uniref:B-cell receptor CD22-like n=1 Tax=Rhineura floridana TaxID=261503 RepID=UPI002AC88C30|nr:B-cell receptor CD22-like [Rhineura floridana]
MSHLHGPTMKCLFWLLFLAGSIFCHYPLRINPNSLVAWKGSCVLIPCQITETHNSAVVRATGIVWFFEPFWDNSLLDYNGNLLYDTSKTVEDNVIAVSPAFQGRVRFIGDLGKRDCSLMITQLRTNDSGRYGARVVASVGKDRWRHKWFLRATVNVTESPPEPKMEILTQGRTVQVTCSVSYHCPHEPITLTLLGLEKPRLSSQKMTIENGMIQTTMSFEPTWEEAGEDLVCLMSQQDGSDISLRTVQLHMKHRPKDVELTILNGLPIKEGDTVVLNCSAGRSNPSDNWYNWFKIDPHTVEYKYSGSKLLTFSAVSEAIISYQCEVCNIIDCTSSPTVTMDVHFAPKEVNIQKEPEGTIPEGSPVKLSCDVGKAKPQNLSYTWYKDGQRLDLDLDSASEKLIIPEVVAAHSGSYWCEASNTVGTSRSPIVKLHVIGFLHDESTLSINPNSLVAWKGSCVLIPCHISNMLNSATVNVIAVAWYFEPFWDYNWHDYNGSLLYDSSKTTEDNVIATSPAFQSRVSFEGDLGNKDCSLMITQLQTKDSGRYGVRVIASVGNYPWRFKWFLSGTVNVTESPPKPKLETIPVQIKEQRITKVTCLVPYHCPNVLILLTLRGLETHRLSSQENMIENRTIWTRKTFEPTWEDNGKMLVCLLSNLEGSEISQTTMKLDVRKRDTVPDRPKDVKLAILNELPIKEGDTVMLNCSAGRSDPTENWYNWFKIDPHTVEYKYSGSKLLTFSAVSEPITSYECEVCNNVGCNSSPTVTVDVHFAPKEVLIWKKPKGVIHENSQVQLGCQVKTANPPKLKYIWYKDGRPLDSADNLLTIHNMTSEHSGTYQCEAKNSVGASRSPDIMLDVHS